MKILSFFFVLYSILILLHATCTEKPANPVEVNNAIFPAAPQNIEATVEDRKIILS